MVMGPTHAMSGAGGWLLGAGVITAATGYHQSPIELLVYTTVCAGAALLPDLDCSGRVLSNRGGSLAAHTFGIVSLFFAECVEKFSLAVYLMTRGPGDKKRSNGHRTFTHTWFFAIAIAIALSFAVAKYEKTAVVVVLALTIGLAIRGLLAEFAKKSGWLLITLTTAALTVTAAQNLPADNGYPLLGIAVGAGCFIHTLGDMATHAGCPVLWPVPIGRKLWFPWGLPDSIALRAGGAVELGLVLPTLTVLTIAAGLWQFPPTRAVIDSALA